MPLISNLSNRLINMTQQQTVNTQRTLEHLIDEAQGGPMEMPLFSVVKQSTDAVLFCLQSLLDVFYLSCDVRMIGWQILQSAKHSCCFFIVATFNQPTRANDYDAFRYT